MEYIFTINEEPTIEQLNQLMLEVKEEVIEKSRLAEIKYEKNYKDALKLINTKE